MNCKQIQIQAEQTYATQYIKTKKRKNSNSNN